VFAKGQEKSLNYDIFVKKLSKMFGQAQSKIDGN
jgi:hypothetical protein